jgi:hypothetical protein
MVRVVNLRHEAYDIYMGRPGKGQAGLFGNKFIIGKDGKRGECVGLFEDWFGSNEPDAVAYRKLVDQTIKPNDRLGCFCKPAACHADIVAEYVNNGYKL